LALATAGGFTIGFVVGPVSILAKSDADQKILTAILAMALGAGIGAAVGVMLGMLAGLVIGAVGAIWLVPYRGNATTNWTLRLAATATVAMWFMLLAQENVYSAPTSFDFWAIDIPALAGAWYVSPWVGGWYVDRMREPT
jgi:hypothetical protein